MLPYCRGATRNGPVGALVLWLLTAFCWLGAVSSSDHHQTPVLANAYNTYDNTTTTTTSSSSSSSSGRSWREPRAGRVRRFIYFPEGSTITVTVDFVIPLGDSGASLTFSPSITFTPTTIARAAYGDHGDHGEHGGYGGGYGGENGYGPGPQAESRSFGADQRRLMDTIRDGFKQVGLDGGACLQRLVCEVSGAPRHHDGLLGEVINTVLLNDYIDPSENEVGTEVAVFTNSSTTEGGMKNANKFDSEEVAAARLHGSFHGNCAERYSTCPVSIFNIF